MRSVARRIYDTSSQKNLFGQLPEEFMITVARKMYDISSQKNV